MIRSVLVNRVRRGFSVVELIVTIGVLALIVVGIATIFGTVGDTVTAGQDLSERGRRFAQLEQTMRADFRRLTQRGPLVIRHEYAIREQGGATDVPLNEDDASPRPRRIDQVMFFVEADPGRRITTLRRAVEPTMIASGTEARIWYGHGQQVRDGAGDDIDYSETLANQLDPNLADLNFDLNARLGLDPGPGVVNPNEFAGDWTLLRHQTVLVPLVPGEQQPLPDYPDGRLYGIAVDRDVPEQRAIVSDAPFQVQLQPAMSSAFWNLQAFTDGGAPVIVGGTGRSLVEGVSLTAAPLLDQRLLYNRVYRDSPPYLGDRDILTARVTSGLVDIATTSLDEIRSIATAADFDVRNAGVGDAGTFADELETLIKEAEGGSEPAFPLSPLTDDGELARVKARHWIIDLLPTMPVWPGTAWDPAGRSTQRIRFDTTPTGLLGEAAAAGDALDAAYAAADSEVLTRWAFLPGCTEFIVEYSFGEVYDENKQGVFNASAGDPRYGQLIWYGRDRFALNAAGQPIDVNNDGSAGNDADRVAHTYRPSTTEGAEIRPTDLIIGVAGAPADEDNFAPGTTERRTLYESVFGYRDPGPTPATFSAENAGREGEWVWPTLIRITLFFPRNPDDLSEGETSYEMVFQVPQD